MTAARDFLGPRASRPQRSAMTMQPNIAAEVTRLNGNESRKPSLVTSAATRSCAVRLYGRGLDGGRDVCEPSFAVFNFTSARAVVRFIFRLPARTLLVLIRIYQRT